MTRLSWSNNGLNKPLMSSFHASFSIGALAGALLGAGIAWLTIGSISAFYTRRSSFWPHNIAFFRTSTAGEAEPAKGDSLFRLPPKIVWPLGAIAFCAAIGEGAMADWSAVFSQPIAGNNGRCRRSWVCRFFTDDDYRTTSW